MHTKCNANMHLEFAKLYIVGQPDNRLHHDEEAVVNFFFHHLQAFWKRFKQNKRYDFIFKWGEQEVFLPCVQPLPSSPQLLKAVSQTEADIRWHGRVQLRNPEAHMWPSEKCFWMYVSLKDCAVNWLHVCRGENISHVLTWHHRPSIILTGQRSGIRLFVSEKFDSRAKNLMLFSLLLQTVPEKSYQINLQSTIHYF